MLYVLQAADAMDCKSGIKCVKLSRMVSRRNKVRYNHKETRLRVFGEFAKVFFAIGAVTVYRWAASGLTHFCLLLEAPTLPAAMMPQRLFARSVTVALPRCSGRLICRVAFPVVDYSSLDKERQHL